MKVPGSLCLIKDDHLMHTTMAIVTKYWPEQIDSPSRERWMMIEGAAW